MVLEPIRVVIPPRIATKLKGIKNLLKELSVSLIIPCNIGMKIITTGVLLIKALKTKTKNRLKKITILGLFGKKLIKLEI